MAITDTIFYQQLDKFSGEKKTRKEIGFVVTMGSQITDNLIVSPLCLD